MCPTTNTFEPTGDVLWHFIVKFSQKNPKTKRKKTNTDIMFMTYLNYRSWQFDQASLRKSSGWRNDSQFTSQYFLIELIKLNVLNHKLTFLHISVLENDFIRYIYWSLLLHCNMDVVYTGPSEGHKTFSIVVLLHSSLFIDYSNCAKKKRKYCILDLITCVWHMCQFTLAVAEHNHKCL